jgi:hypothetical protein
MRFFNGLPHPEEGRRPVSKGRSLIFQQPVSVPELTIAAPLSWAPTSRKHRARRPGLPDLILGSSPTRFAHPLKLSAACNGNPSPTCHPPASRRRDRGTQCSPACRSRLRRNSFSVAYVPSGVVIPSVVEGVYRDACGMCRLAVERAGAGREANGCRNGRETQPVHCSSRCLDAPIQGVADRNFRLQLYVVTRFNTNIVVGQESTVYNNWFAFDLALLDGYTVTSATLTIPEIGAYITPRSEETYGLFNYTGNVDNLLDGTGGVGCIRRSGQRHHLWSDASFDPSFL